MFAHVSGMCLGCVWGVSSSGCCCSSSSAPLSDGATTTETCPFVLYYGWSGPGDCLGDARDEEMADKSKKLHGADVSGMCLGCVWDVSSSGTRLRMCLGCVWDVSGVCLALEAH